MRMTVIPDDKFVSVDGVGKIDLTFQCPANVHAFQWYGEFGEVEYKTLLENGVLVKPPNEVVQSYADFQGALDAWSVPPPEPPPPSPPTESDYAAAIQGHIDATARSKDYADGVALASYVNSTIQQWASEADAFVAWRDQVWVYAYTELAKVQSGTRPQPEITTLIGELPPIAWPN